MGTLSTPNFKWFWHKIPELLRSMIVIIQKRSSIDHRSSWWSRSSISIDHDRHSLATAKSNINRERISSNNPSCTSWNLDNDTRISACDPTADDIYREARHLINAIHCERIRRIKSMTKWHSMILLIVFGINKWSIYQALIHCIWIRPDIVLLSNLIEEGTVQCIVE